MLQTGDTSLHKTDQNIEVRLLKFSVWCIKMHCDAKLWECAIHIVNMSIFFILHMMYFCYATRLHNHVLIQKKKEFLNSFQLTPVPCHWNLHCLRTRRTWKAAVLAVFGALYLVVMTPQEHIIGHFDYSVTFLGKFMHLFFIYYILTYCKPEVHFVFNIYMIGCIVPVRVQTPDLCFSLHGCWH